MAKAPQALLSAVLSKSLSDRSSQSVQFSAVLEVAENYRLQISSGSYEMFWTSCHSSEAKPLGHKTEKQ